MWRAMHVCGDFEIQEVRSSESTAVYDARTLAVQHQEPNISCYSKDLTIRTHPIGSIYCCTQKEAKYEVPEMRREKLTSRDEHAASTINASRIGS